MEQSQILWLAVGLIAGVVLITMARKLWDFSRPKAACAHCDSNNVRIDSKAFDFAYVGYPFGRGIRVKHDAEVTYHCNACDKESMVKTTKTY